MKTRVFKVCAAVLISMLMFITGLSFLSINRNTRNIAHATTMFGEDGTGAGTADAPFFIGSLETFIEFAPKFSSPGTFTNPRHFVITNDINMSGFISPNSTLANYVILDGQNFELYNLSSSLFNTVRGPNSVIKNLEISGDAALGSGNIAYNFSGTMDNVHNIDGNVLFTTSSGGLVNYSENATFRYCSNKARVRRSPGGNTTDVNGGLVGWAKGNLNILHCYNEGDVVTMGTAEVSGGLVGKIINTENELATIGLSHNAGFINGNRSAGIVGKKEGTGKLVIKESYNEGTITNRSTNPEAAGILAWADNDGEVEITCCYNTGTISNTVTNAQSTGYAGPSGIFSKNSGASITISNTYNVGSVRNAIYHTTTNNAISGIKSERNYVRQGANSISTLGNNVTSRSDMAQVAFLPVINNTLVPEAFRRDPGLNNGYPVLVGLTTVNFIFNPNGGTINNDANPIRLDQSEVPTTSLLERSKIKRVGFDFIGWSTNAQAARTNPNELPDETFENHIDILNVVPLVSTTYYAVWEPTPYTINVITSTNIAGNQNYEICNDQGEILTGNTVTFGQKIYLQTWVSAAGNSSGENYFVEWMIKTGSASDAWAPFNDGFRPLLPPTITSGSTTKYWPEELQLYKDGESIINETFLSHSVDGVITLMGKYVLISSLKLNVDTAPGQRNWGTLKIDDVQTSFPKKIPFETTDNIKISVQPNNFYSFVGFKTRALGSTADWDDINISDIDFDETSGYHSYTIENASSDTELQAIFKPISYRINVKAQTVGGEAIPNQILGTLITDSGAPQTISLGETFKNISLKSAGNYTLVHETRDNIKIKYQRTGDYAVYGEYAFRTANNGQINLPITTQFLTDFWNENWNPENPDGESIEIIAIFIELVQFDLSVNDSNLGLATVSVRGLTPRVATNIENFHGALAMNSSVTIHFLPLYDARIVSIIDLKQPVPIYDSSSSQEPPLSYTFTLTQPVDIFVEYAKLAFTFELSITDNHRNTSTNFTLPTTPVVEVGTDAINTTPVGWKVDGLGINNVIRITKGNYDSNEWRFVGWYIVYGDGQEEYLRGDSDSNDLIDGHVIIIDDEFIEKYLFDSVNILVEARFAKIFNVNIGLVRLGSGTVSGDEGQDIRLGKTRHDAATPIKILLFPTKHYELAGIDGLKEGEQINFNDLTIIIYVTEARDLKINFVPIQNSIVSNNKLSNNGKMNVKSSSGRTLGIGDRVTLQYTPGIGFERAGWKINGISVNDIKTLYPNSKAKVTGNTVSFTITWDWFNDWANDDHTIKLDSRVTTRINTFMIVGITAVAIITPTLIIGLILLILANKRRKAEYAIALQKMKLGKARLGHADLIRSLKEGE